MKKTEFVAMLLNTLGFIVLAVWCMRHQARIDDLEWCVNDRDAAAEAPPLLTADGPMAVDSGGPCKCCKCEACQCNAIERQKAGGP